MKTKGLSVNVYRWSLGDCTNHGMSEKQDDLILVDIPNCPFHGDETNSVRLVKRILFGREYIHAEPVSMPPVGMVGPMMGGNFIYSCDSRFPFDYPIPLHDRYETVEDYYHLSL